MLIKKNDNEGTPTYYYKPLKLYIRVQLLDSILHLKV